MPEWFTHVALGLLLAELLQVKKKSIVILGAILPDILVKLTLVRLFLPIPDIDYSILGALHVPFVFFLFTLVVAPLFHYRYGRIVLWLNLGAMSHFLSDALLRHVAGGGVRLFYPLSLKYYNVDLIWPEKTYLLGSALVLTYGLLLVGKRWWVHGPVKKSSAPSITTNPQLPSTPQRPSSPLNYYQTTSIGTRYPAHDPPSS